MPISFVQKTRLWIREFLQVVFLSSILTSLMNLLSSSGPGHLPVLPPSFYLFLFGFGSRTLCGSPGCRFVACMWLHPGLHLGFTQLLEELRGTTLLHSLTVFENVTYQVYCALYHLRNYREIRQ